MAAKCRVTELTSTKNLHIHTETPFLASIVGKIPTPNLKLVVGPFSGYGGPLFQPDNLRISKLLALRLGLAADYKDGFQFTGLTANQYCFFSTAFINT